MTQTRQEREAAARKECAQAWEEYEKVRDPAWEEYKKACAQAWEEYEKACGPALEEYEKKLREIDAEEDER